MLDEASFLQIVETDPADNVTRGVYADWLEETGRADQGEFLRLQLAVRNMPLESRASEAARERLRELGRRLDPKWLQTVDSLARLGNLSLRARRWAVRLGVTTVSDLCEHSVGTILDRTFGMTVIKEYQGVLAEHGLRLRDD